jgi:hypothetical protein
MIFSPEDTNKKYKQPYDKLFKLTFYDLQNIKNFLMVYLVNLPIGKIKEDSIRIDNEKLVNYYLKESIADLIVTCDVLTDSGKVIELIVFIEEQTKVCDHMSYRFFRYLFGRYDPLFRNMIKNQEPISFPAVQAVIIHPGAPWGKYRQMKDLIQGQRKGLRSILHIPTKLFNVKTQGKIIKQFNLELQTYFCATQTAASRLMEVNYPRVIEKLAKACSIVTDKVSKEHLIILYR